MDGGPKKPESAVLNIPGWSGKDAKNLEALDTDLQITPTGHYAVAFAKARWNQSAEGAAREPDDIITVVDLKRWQIVASTNAANFDLGGTGDAQVLDDERSRGQHPAEKNLFCLSWWCRSQRFRLVFIAQPKCLS